MLLRDIDGSASVELTVVSYQYPDLAASGRDFDWDANWLQVHGVVTAATRWRFTDPCLTTAEAAALSLWLSGAADGTVEPGSEPIGFLEPNISVKLDARDADSATLVWYFSQESSPPGASEDVRFGVGQPVVVRLSSSDLLDAQVAWEDEISKFPVRRGR